MLRNQARHGLIRRAVQDAARLRATGYRLMSTKQDGEVQIETEMPLPDAIVNKQRLKPTPAAGFKIPRVKKGETVIGQRVYGDTDIFSTPKNFNFVMRRQDEEQTKMRLLMMVIAVSMIPILYNVWNAETKFK